jgi:hypothetical protein
VGFNAGMIQRLGGVLRFGGVRGPPLTILQSAPFHPAGQSQSPVSKLQLPTPLQSAWQVLLPRGAGFHATICSEHASRGERVGQDGELACME